MSKFDHITFHAGWNAKVDDRKLIFYKLTQDTEKGIVVTFAVSVETDFRFRVNLHGCAVSVKCSVLRDLPPLLDSGMSIPICTCT